MQGEALLEEGDERLGWGRFSRCLDGSVIGQKGSCGNEELPQRKQGGGEVEQGALKGKTRILSLPRAQ